MKGAREEIRRFVSGRETVTTTEIVDHLRDSGLGGYLPSARAIGQFLRDLGWTAIRGRRIVYHAPTADPVDPSLAAAAAVDLVLAAEAVLSSAFATHYRLISPFKELGAAVAKARGATAA